MISVYGFRGLGPRVQHIPQALKTDNKAHQQATSLDASSFGQVRVQGTWSAVSVVSSGAWFRLEGTRDAATSRRQQTM